MEEKLITDLEARLSEMLTRDDYDQHWKDIICGITALAALITARALPQTTVNNYTVHQTE